MYLYPHICVYIWVVILIFVTSHPPSPENSNLTLSVKLEDDGDTRRPTSSENHYHSLGDITFIPLPNATFDITPYTLYYDYNFGDGYHQKNSTAKNVTHSYSKEGNLTFSVDAIAVDANKQAYHAVYSSYIILIGKSVLYVCMYVCMYVCTYILCMYVCMYIVCTMYVCMYVCTNSVYSILYRARLALYSGFTLQLLKKKTWHGYKKRCEGRPGYEVTTRSGLPQ